MCGGALMARSPRPARADTHSIPYPQEPALPPPGCPSAVRRLAGAAFDAHARRECGEALELLAAAQEAWEARSAACERGSGCSSGGSDADGSGSDGSGSDASGGGARRRELLGISPAMTLFFGLAEAGVLLTAGRDTEARGALLASGPALGWLNEAGADTAAWHAGVGVVAYHLGDLRVRLANAAVPGA
jgi:hypothetical protein